MKNSVKKGKTILPPIEKYPSLIEILNMMFEEKKEEEDGKTLISYIDTEPASRQQAAELFKALDEKVKSKQARETGICAVREELYSQCFYF